MLRRLPTASNTTGASAVIHIVSLISLIVVINICSILSVVVGQWQLSGRTSVSLLFLYPRCLKASTSLLPCWLTYRLHLTRHCASPRSAQYRRRSSPPHVSVLSGRFRLRDCLLREIFHHIVSLNMCFLGFFLPYFFFIRFPSNLSFCTLSSCTCYGFGAILVL
ncbi:hypothetical protein CPC08DRAFT_317881 [Agrocybe pediades]|nr:hypothetical protein CPC08DRAFT_317881 [Agrocybe pediades]